jgi:4-hydroxyproline epimerase
VVVSGGPALEGNTMSEKRQHFLKEFDWIRKGLMFEPRGHDMMSGSILYPPHNPENDMAVLFIETSGCLPMCGHGTIGTITVAIEAGLIQPKVPGKIRMEAPAGLVQIEYTMKGKKVSSVKLTNVASFMAAENIQVECPDLGMLTIDVCYGGNYYAIVEVQENFKGIENYTAGQLIAWSGVIRKRINESNKFVHPLDPTINGCSHISARLAHWHAKGKLKQGVPFLHESIIGSVFTGKVESTTNIGDKQAIIPSIEGWAKIYGFNTISIDKQDDPYASGFQVV